MEQDMAQGRAEQMVQCNNCGTSWFHEAPQASAVCPVCRFAAGTDEPRPRHVGSVAGLEDQLAALVRNALASGLSSDTIVHALRDELAFVAELGNVGRRFTVQLIDLGPREADLLQSPLPGRRDMASNRGSA